LGAEWEHKIIWTVWSWRRAASADVDAGGFEPTCGLHGLIDRGGDAAGAGWLSARGIHVGDISQPVARPAAVSIKPAIRPRVLSLVVDLVSRADGSRASGIIAVAAAVDDAAASAARRLVSVFAVDGFDFRKALDGTSKPVADMEHRNRRQ
jgi:hypothetical protein